MTRERIDMKQFELPPRKKPRAPVVDDPDLAKFVLRQEEGAPVDGAMAADGFDIHGQSIETSDVRCVAFRQHNPTTGARHHAICVARSGALAGKLFDPAHHDGDGVIPRSGRHEHVFREVSKECFESYLNFLRTGNRARLLQAERHR